MSDILERLEAEMNKSSSVLLTAALAEAAHEITQLRRRSSWRPIETAPKDGTEVLIWDSHMRVRRIGFYDFGWYDQEGRIACPTHWMPLPEPPKSEET